MNDQIVNRGLSPVYFKTVTADASLSIAFGLKEGSLLLCKQ